ncbi:MAG: DUF2147 domain-containing protein [Pseudomonadota bacterium]
MLRILTLSIAMLAASPFANADSHDVYGTFLTEEGTSKVEISDCGDGTPCGKVIWIDPESLEDGLTPETVKTRSTGEPVLGLTMLSDFSRSSGDWRGGTIYSPKADKSYSSRLKRLDQSTLEVKGCIGFICQTQLWSLAE